MKKTKIAVCCLSAAIMVSIAACAPAADTSTTTSQATQTESAAETTTAKTTEAATEGTTPAGSEDAESFTVNKVTFGTFSGKVSAINAEASTFTLTTHDGLTDMESIPMESWMGAEELKEGVELTAAYYVNPADSMQTWVVALPGKAEVKEISGSLDGAGMSSFTVETDAESVTVDKEMGGYTDENVLNENNKISAYCLVDADQLPYLIAAFNQ